MAENPLEAEIVALVSLIPGNPTGHARLAALDDLRAAQQIREATVRAAERSRIRRELDAESAVEEDYAGLTLEAQWHRYAALVLRNAARRICPEAPVAPSPWRLIETAPKDGSSFIAAWEPPLGYEPRVAYWGRDSGEWLNLNGGDFSTPPTHWMPLPAGPR